jgi:(2Fe-2S) ferredoxin
VTEPDPPPFYAAHIFVCTNRRLEGHPRGCCAARGSEKLRDYMKARAKELKIPDIRVNTAGCLERCEFGPALVIYPDGVWYRPTCIEDVEEILQVHVIGGGRVRRLMLTEADVPPPKG